MLILKAKYEELFPIESNVRFVADQLYELSKVLFIIIGIATLQLLFAVFIWYFSGLEFIASLGFSFLGDIVIFILIGVYYVFRYVDYVEWKKEQARYYAQLNIGQYDQEAATNVKPQLSRRMKVLNKLFPIGSPKRYIARTLLILGIVAITIAIHYAVTLFVAHLIFGPEIKALSTKTGKREVVPNLQIYIIGFTIQFVVLILGSVVYFAIDCYCESAWSLHKQRAESAVAHSD